MKDNDLLVTELYRDPGGEKVTALSVYLTPKSCEYKIPCMSERSFITVLTVSTDIFYTVLYLLVIIVPN